MLCSKKKHKLVEEIKKYGYIGRSGDGWIFVSGIERAVRVRTGEENVIN